MHSWLATFSLNKKLRWSDMAWKLTYNSVQRPYAEAKLLHTFTRGRRFANPREIWNQPNAFTHTLLTVSLTRTKYTSPRRLINQCYVNKDTKYRKRSPRKASLLTHLASIHVYTCTHMCALPWGTFFSCCDDPFNLTRPPSSRHNRWARVNK